MLLRSLLFLALAIPAGATDPVNQPPASEVLRRALERVKAEDQENAVRKFGWTQRTVQEKLDRTGQVEERTEKVFVTVLVDGEHYMRLVEKDGKPLSPDEQKKEVERERKFRERTAKQKSEGRKNEKNEDSEDGVTLNAELVARYHFQLVGTELVEGRSAHILTFLPKVGVRLPENKRFDRILNRLEGKVWIDSVTYSLLKVDLHLTEPTTLMAGLVSVRSLDLAMRFTEIAPGVFGPRNVDLSFAGRRLFSNMNVRQEVEFVDYRRLTETNARKE